MKRDGISAIKFEAAQIHCLSDVFVAVAVVVASIGVGPRAIKGKTGYKGMLQIISSCVCLILFYYHSFLFSL